MQGFHASLLLIMMRVIRICIGDHHVSAPPLFHSDNLGAGPGRTGAWRRAWAGQCPRASRCSGDGQGLRRQRSRHRSLHVVAVARCAAPSRGTEPGRSVAGRAWCGRCPRQRAGAEPSHPGALAREHRAAGRWHAPQRGPASWCARILHVPGVGRRRGGGQGRGLGAVRHRRTRRRGAGALATGTVPSRHARTHEPERGHRQPGCARQRHGQHQPR